MPLPLDHNIASVLIDRLLVCLGLVVTTALVVRNQELERQASRSRWNWGRRIFAAT